MSAVLTSPPEASAADLRALSRLQALSIRLVHSGQLQPLLQEILRAAADLTHTDKGSIQLFDEAGGRPRTVVHQGLGERLVRHFAGGGAPCDAAARRHERVIVEDLGALAHLAGTPDLQVLRDDGIRAFQSTPLVTREGRLLGRLDNHYRSRYRPGEREQRCLDLLARMAADFVERCQHEAALEANRRELEAELQAMRRLQEMSERLVRAGDFAQLLDELLDAAIAITGADKGHIQLVADGALELVAQRGFGAAFSACFARVDHPRSACAEALVSGRRVVVPDVAASPLWDAGARAAMLADQARAVQSTPLVGRSGGVLGMVSTHWSEPGRVPSERAQRSLDVLARMAADLIALRGAEQALREADRRKDEFLATLAHELRNPLAPIRNAVHLMKLLPLPDTALQATHIVDRQVGKMVRLIDDLLDNSRFTHGKLTLRSEPLVLQDVLRHAVESVGPQVAAAGHALEVRLPEAPLRLEGDAVRLVQVFSNLLDNACKYTLAGGRIVLEAVCEDGRWAVVRVRDNGIGISRDHLPHLFRMFSQAEGALERSRGGLGIGLSLAQGLVSLHGGSIAAASAGPGEGSEFTVRLPLQAAAVPAPAAHAPAAEPKAARLRIGVVDDNPDAAASLARLLQLLGHEVALAHDGEQALRLCEEFRPRVLLLDLGIPKGNGYETCRRLRATPRGRRMQVYAVTGWGQDEDRRRSQECGFDRHLVKPVDPGELARLLSMLPADEPPPDGQDHDAAAAALRGAG